MTNPNKTAQVTFPMLLGLLFIGLKLSNIITWPWLWVLSPFWIPILILIIVYLVIWFMISRLH